MSEKSLNIQAEANKRRHKIEENQRKLGNEGQKGKQQNFNQCSQTNRRIHQTGIKMLKKKTRKKNNQIKSTSKLI